MEAKELGFTLLHLGMNQENEAEGVATAALLSKLFGFEQRDTSGSIFVNEQFEVMKKPFRGTKGHIALGTNDAPAAKAWLESQGITFDETTAKYDETGKLTLVYANEEIGGFAFHITQMN